MLIAYSAVRALLPDRLLDTPAARSGDPFHLSVYRRRGGHGIAGSAWLPAAISSMPNDPDPLLTVVYPIIDVRGRADAPVRSWTDGQTLARDRYRVVAAFDDTTPSQEREVEPLLCPRDELLRVPGANDAALWNAGAERARTPWLIFTEGHCLADPGCLEAVARWIDANPGAEAGNFHIAHRDDHPLAPLKHRWFDLIQVSWRAPGEWPRLQRAGFAIRADIFKAGGGFEAEYGPFAPQLLSARLHQRGVRIDSIPGASVIHLDEERMRSHHGDTAAYVVGELEARSRHEPVFFERYFGHAPIWTNQLLEQPRVVGRMARAVIAAVMVDPGRASEVAAAVRSTAWRVVGAAWRAAFHRVVVTLDEIAVERLPLPREWRWARFLRAHARVVRLTQLDWIRRRSALCGLPGSFERSPVEQLGPATISGVHGLEPHGGRTFRWTQPIVLMRWAAPDGEHELRIETGGIRGDPLAAVVAVVADGRVLPRESLTADDDGTLVVRLPKRRPTTAEVVVICSPLVPARQGSPDGRALGLPVLAIGIKAGQERDLAPSSAALLAH